MSARGRGQRTKKGKSEPLRSRKRPWPVQAGFWALAVGVSLAALFGLALRPTESETRAARLAGQELRLEIADSPEQWAVGLMNRSQLGEKEGMLFVFGSEANRSFWMKNVRFPLDLIYFDSELRVVGFREGLPPCAGLICRVYSGPRAAYVLEVRAGSVEKWGVRAGQRLELR